MIIFENVEQMEDVQNLDAQGDIEEMISFLDSLFGEQIPVKGTSVNYVAQDECIVSKDDVDETEETEPLTLVTLLHTDSLWIDPLRAIAEEERYTVYSRITEDGFSSEWHPTRLTRVLQDVFPQQAEDLNRLLNEALIDISSDAAPTGLDLEVSKSLGQILDTYDSLIREEGATVPEETTTECRRVVQESGTSDIEPESFSEATDRLRNYADCLSSDDQAVIDISSDRLSEIRRRSILGEDSNMTQSSDLEDTRVIQSSPIGIYW